jgi:hypothetical protein
MPHKRWALLLALLIICSVSVPAQRRSKRRAAPQPRSRGARVTTTDQYWAAQRSIAAAIQQLEAYLKANPDGEHAATAKQQLEVLRGLSLAASQPEWASMNPRNRDSAPEWGLTSIERQPDVTRVTVEIRCPRQDSGECYFIPFDRALLVLFDNAGRYYSMLDAGTLPRDVRVTGRERAEVTPGQAILSGGRSITITIEFAPLTSGAVSLQIYYRDDNRTEPAKYSLLGRH